MMVPVSLANAKRERLARVAASSVRALALRSYLGRSFWMLLSIAALAGCHQQTTTGDPFLPFYRSRVPPPGTSVPPGGVPVDPYYNGTPGAAAPIGTPAAPVVTPVVPPPVDKYSPRGGFNVPQGSIDRTKAIDFAKSNEVKASPTAIARRSLTTPVAGRTQVDTQLTSARTALPASAETATPTSSAPNYSTSIASTPLPVTPGVSPLAALTPLVPKTTASQADYSSMSDDEAIDSVVAAFDGAGRPAAASVSGARSALTSPAQPEAETSEPSQDDLAAARARMLRSGAAESVNHNTIRIRDAAEDAFADDEEPAAQATSDGPTRLRVTAGASLADVSSKSIEEEPQQEPAVVGADARPGVHFSGSEPDAGAEQALWLEPADGSADRVATVAATAVASASDPYRYDPSYGSLSGRLEYSASSRQWKLRYIPIDGPTDQFGGSVLLADSTRLEGFKPGDFVTVRGAIAAAAQNARGYSPRYQLSQIDSIR